MNTIPDTVSCYGATPELAERTIPQKLRRSHHTAATSSLPQAPILGSND